MRWMASASVLASLALGSLSHAATPVSAVSPELLDGTSLRVTADNFAIDAPGPGWTWQQAQLGNISDKLFICQGTEGGRFLLAVLPDNSVESGDAWFQRFIADSRASQARSGRQLSNFAVQPFDKPAPGSFRWSGDLDIPGQGRTRWQGVATRADRIFALQYYGDDPVLATTFDRWVASFRSLQPPRGGLRGFVGTTAIVLGFIALVLGASFAWLGNVLARRPVMNPGFVAVGLIVAILAGEVWFLWSRGLFPSEPEAAGQLVGMLTGNALLPLVGAVALSYHHRKRIARSA